MYSYLLRIIRYIRFRSYLFCFYLLHIIFVSLLFASYHICFASICFYLVHIIFVSLLFGSYHIRFASNRFLSYLIRIPNFLILLKANISESNPSIRYFAQIYSLPDSLYLLRSEYEGTPYHCLAESKSG
jgi:hypothetical protein